MKRVLIFACLVVAMLLVWVGVVGIASRLGWMRAMPAAKGDSAGFIRFVANRYAAESRGNIVILLLDHGRVAGSYGNSQGRPVDVNSLFQVASLSKWLTAWGVMSLVDHHRIELDAPVERYLKRWHLPASRFDNDKVTVRRLLAHTAGLTDGLGFRGFPPGGAVPTIEQELARVADAEPEANGVVRVGARPGSTWRYSGGGYLILQLLIEDVTHESFNGYMRRVVFQPLEMSESTFVDPDPSRLVDSYASDGTKAVRYQFTALGAASLYTSAADLAKFLQAQLPGPNGALAGRGVLTPETLNIMRTPQAYLYGLPFWGLGEALYAPDGMGGYVAGHDGENEPAINTTARLNPANGDGIIVLETGSAQLASEIGGEWTYWQTGKRSIETMVVFDSRDILILFSVGALIIAVVAILSWRLRWLSGRKGLFK